MKKLLIVLIALAVLLSVIPLSGFGQEKYTPKPNEELYGTWVNKEMIPQKMVKNPGGLCDDYYQASATIPMRSAKEEIVKKWVDAEGNIYYTTFDRFISGAIEGHAVESQVSKSGTVLEMNWHDAWVNMTRIIVQRQSIQKRAAILSSIARRNRRPLGDLGRLDGEDGSHRMMKTRGWMSDLPRTPSPNGKSRLERQ